jgi:cellulose biosynthesis protein BcsQ
MITGEQKLTEIHTASQRRTISGYIEERISSPYMSPNVGAKFITNVSEYNACIPKNVYLVVGDERLEIQSSRVTGATFPGPQDAWRIVHLWIKDLISDIQESWNNEASCVFIDCNPSFSIYTELAMTASDRLLIPFSADGSSKRAVKALLALVYGITRHTGDPQSEFHLESSRYRMAVPSIYMYIGNRLTQMNSSSASAFKTVVNEIGEEIWGVWQVSSQNFSIHPNGAPTPTSKKAFKTMFQFEVKDANTASVVSGALGIPIASLSAGQKQVAGRSITVNQSQLDKQVPNIKGLAESIE